MTALAFYSKEIIQKGKTLIPIHVLLFVCMSSFYLEIIFFILITPYFIKLSLGFPPLLLFGLQSTDEEKKIISGFRIRFFVLPITKKLLFKLNWHWLS